MSTLVFMRVLESAPSRYDRGMKLITLGKIPAVYENFAELIDEGDKVLDIGCGTGLFTLMAAKSGASVKAIDINPEMLEIAKKRASEFSLSDKIEFQEMGVAELDKEDTGSYDFIFAGLVFSELEDYELDYTLKEIYRLLSPTGKFVMIDEISPSSIIQRLLQKIIRLPLVIFTYILTQTTTHSLPNPRQKLLDLKFKIVDQRSYMMSSLTYFTCSKEEQS